MWFLKMLPNITLFLYIFAVAVLLHHLAFCLPHGCSTRGLWESRGAHWHQSFHQRICGLHRAGSVILLIILCTPIYAQRGHDFGFSNWQSNAVSSHWLFKHISIKTLCRNPITMWHSCSDVHITLPVEHWHGEYFSVVHVLIV